MIIILLNFADGLKPGGGYLNGCGDQEETLCRQTLLYPTLVGNDMYSANRRSGDTKKGSDVMIYSPNVYVILDDTYSKIDNPFKVNIISSPDVENRRSVGGCFDAARVMEKQIGKIVRLAASKNNDVLILGAFGCGVFKNDPRKVAESFRKVLKDKGMKDYFKGVLDRTPCLACSSRSSMRD